MKRRKFSVHVLTKNPKSMLEICKKCIEKLYLLICQIIFDTCPRFLESTIKKFIKELPKNGLTKFLRILAKKPKSMLDQC